MCIMEVREGQKVTTIAQAMAHNTSTVERDLDMFELLLKSRGEHETLKSVELAHAHLKHAYAAFLEVYGEELYLEASGQPHSHGHDAEHVEQIGNEREHASARALETALVIGEQHDAQLARRFETR